MGEQMRDDLNAAIEQIKYAENKAFDDDKYPERAMMRLAWVQAHAAVAQAQAATRQAVALERIAEAMEHPPSAVLDIDDAVARIVAAIQQLTGQAAPFAPKEPDELAESLLAK